MAIALALLVSADPITIEQFNHALQELSISPDVCQEAPASIRLLNCRKYDAVIVDLQLGEQSGRVLDEVRLSPSNRTAVTFAIGGSDAEATAVFRKKAAFVFEKPLSAESIRSTLKPAFGLILRERRRYFRYPVAVPVTILRQTMPEICCYSVNISEQGMAMSTSVSFTAGDDVRVQFSCRITKYHSWQNRQSAGRKRAISACALCLFHGSTNTNSKIGYQKSWKKRFRNSSPGNSRRRTAAPYQPG